MECEHNLDIATLQHLVLQLSDILTCIQSVSQLVYITAGGDFLGLCDKKVHIYMGPILDGYGILTA